MKYLALGDSMSIDTYTGVEGGGAASQFARLIGTEDVQDLTRDGNTIDRVLQSLENVSIHPDIVTLTAGGNDLLLQPCFAGPDDVEMFERAVREPLDKLALLAGRLAEFHCPVIMNTVYDPTDGDDFLLRELGFSPGFRSIYEAVNYGIRELARSQGFILSDLQVLFKGHGMNSSDSWVAMQIEPNLEGATAIARNWYDLLLVPR